jgi:HAD superfamily hydrolase (TIGR01509 family)
MPSLKLLIFDCDGVLVDSERLAVQVDIQVLASLGWTLTVDEIVERFVGLSTGAMKERISAHLGRELPDDWEEKYEHLYREAFRQNLKPVDGVCELLKSLKMPSCVASSGSHEKMRYTLGLVGLYNFFDGRIFSASEVANGKPAPDLFLHAAAKMKAEPAECAVIEDSPFGVQAAKAAGMIAFGYAGGITPARKLSEAGAIVFGDMNKLPHLLAKHFNSE